LYLVKSLKRGGVTVEKDQKLIIMISKDLLQEIDDFRFRNRIPSRAEAVRQLIEKALADTQSPPSDK